MFKLKKENKKYSSIYNLIIIGILIIGILISFIYLISDLFNKKDIILVDPNNFEIDIYKTKDNIVRNYSTFFTIEDIIVEIYKQIENDNYQVIYDLLSDEYKKIYTKEDVQNIINKYINENINSIDLHERNTSKGRLNFLYKYNENEFICNTDFMIVDNKIDIMISLINDEYVISYFEILRGDVNG